MAACFETWVGEILAAAGEKSVAAHAIAEFRISQLQKRAEDWRQNPILRARDERLYASKYEYDEDATPASSPGKGSKAMALCALLAILAVPLAQVQPNTQPKKTRSRSVSQTESVQTEHFLQPRSCPLLASTLPLETRPNFGTYTPSNNCLMAMARKYE